MSQSSFFSPVWPRIENLTPAIRPHVRLHRHHFRGELWYVLEDRANNKFFRFSPAAHALIGLMDGERTVREIYDQASERLGEDLPSQDEVVSLLAQLHGANVLTTDALPDLQEISVRRDTMRRRKLMQSMRNPLGVRIPLFDPDRFLSITMPLVRPLFSWVGFALWLILVLVGIGTAAIHWQGVTHGVIDRVLSGEGLLLLAIAYPLVKALHELGHGYAVKNWGGEVHELGVMLLVFMPVPYVDASASTAYQEKRRRMVVGGAGIMVELGLASLAMIAWAAMEPGVLRALMFNIMLIGGVSTLLFNGNPLIRFDGYYVFADLIEVPNLATRANRYLGYLVRRYLFGFRHATSPATAPGEPAWFVAYAVASFCYRVFIMVGIALFVSGKFFFIGIALAIWSIVLMIGLPIGKAISYLIGSPELEGARPRALAMSAVLAALVIVPLVAVPIPNGTVAQGVVWAPSDVRVVADASGFVADVSVATGARVAAGDVLVVMQDPLVVARLDVIRAEYNEAEVRLAASEITNPVQAEVAREQLSLASAELDRMDERLASLSILSPANGRFHVAEGLDLPGRYLRKGDLVGYVVGTDNWIVRVAVTQRDIDLVQRETEGISLRFSSDLLTPYKARLVGATPRATVELPSAALTSSGGGAVPANPADGSGLMALESVFLLDLAVEGPLPEVFFGERVLARFDHGRETVAEQLYRVARQVFLRRFDL